MIVTRWPSVPLAIIVFIFSSGAGILDSYLSSAQPRAPISSSSARSPKNLILLIGDGFGPAYATLARAVAGRELVLDAYLVGSAGTAALDSRVTDSAAAATALACGLTTLNGAIAVDSAGVSRRTILEAAEARGMSTGLVTTSRITHATPACFGAHHVSRNEENEIASQMLASGVDLLLGGGSRQFHPLPAAAHQDQRDLLAEAASDGFHLVTTNTELESAASGRLLGLFGPSHMSYVLDRDDSEPSLPAMTRVALDRLSRDPDGFFLMVEGGRIDHAGHDNDPAAAVAEVLEFDSAFNTVLDWSRRDGQTLVVVTADHETGGLSLGTAIDGRARYEFHAEALKPVRKSAEAMASRMTDGENARKVLLEDAGIRDLNEAEATAIDLATRNDRTILIGHAISRRAIVGWTTLGHTGVDVGVYAFGPGAIRFAGHRHLAAVGREMATALGLKIGGPINE
ncbi:MAG: alkaline phosphatase [Candidatus Eisenbacteria bacterium]|nr:alkaline phosphatase [Candidatus Eisenbacteria bacterium]